MLASANDTRREGRVIDGRVRLEQRVGEGGAGEVWRARHLALETDVAVKLLSPRLLSGAARDGWVASFLREASLAKRIDSPYVVRVIECRLSIDFGPYLVMEMLNGLDLFEHIARSWTLEITETARVVAQLCGALEAVHAAGLVHRDVKPENVVLTTRDGRPCATLIDFSIAKEAGTRDEHDGRVSGTPAYLSPERLEGSGGADEQADLWALAVVAYQCLAGTVPFDDRTLGAVCLAVERGTFEPPSAFVPGAPRSLDAWFQRAFARDRANRFGSAAEMRDALVEGWAPFPLGGPFRMEESGARPAGRASGVRSRHGLEDEPARAAR